MSRCWWPVDKETWTAHLAAALVAIPLFAAGATAHAAPDPLISTDDRGADLPPVGRSLFDFLVAEEVDGAWVLNVPYPFEALVDKIEGRLRAGFREPMKRVLHPLGRSLHRVAAAPDYFRYPRAVTAVDTDSNPSEGVSGLMMKDRLFLGYQPVTDSIEMISYNEAAARFEYQVVVDYREGGSPRVTYAPRGVCTACHHNQALIYATQPWAESNTNTKIAALLRAEANSFYGIPASIPFDIPESFDESTDRANYFAAYQRAWQEGCGASGDRDAAIACRRGGLISALRYRLTSGYQIGDSGDGAWDAFSGAVTGGWLSRWPQGVEIPTADIPDYDPLVEATYNTGKVEISEALAQLAAFDLSAVMQFDDLYEPLYERPPREVWRVPGPMLGLAPVEPAWIKRVVRGLAGFLAAADIERLAAHLEAASAPRHSESFPCTLSPKPNDATGFAIVFRCTEAEAIGLRLVGSIHVDADNNLRGVLARTRPDSAAPGGLLVKNGTFSKSDQQRIARFRLQDSVTGLVARTRDGNLIQEITLRWQASKTGDGRPLDAHATIEIAEDFSILTAAVDRLAERTRSGNLDALTDAPFRRVAVLEPLFSELGMPSLDWCCLASDHLPTPELLAEIDE